MPADQGLLKIPGAIGGRAVLCTDTIASLTGASTIDVPSHNLESGSFVFCRTDEALYVVDRDSTDAVNSPDVIAAPLGGRFLKVGNAGSSPSFPLFSAAERVDGGVDTALGPNSTNLWMASGGAAGFVAPRAGTLRRLKFRMIAALGAVNTLTGDATLTAFVNGIASALTLTIPLGFADGLRTDDHLVPVLAGDTVNLVLSSPRGGELNALFEFSVCAEIE